MYDCGRLVSLSDDSNSHDQFDPLENLKRTTIKNSTSCLKFKNLIRNGSPSETFEDQATTPLHDAATSSLTAYWAEFVDQQPSPMDPPPYQLLLFRNQSRKQNVDHNYHRLTNLLPPDSP